MPIPSVPLDVLELILDEVHRDEQSRDAALAACCLVSRMFLQLARERLYRSLFLSYETRAEKVGSGWRRTLEPTPRTTNLLSSLRSDLLGLAALPRAVVFFFDSDVPTDAPLMTKVFWLCPGISTAHFKLGMAPHEQSTGGVGNRTVPAETPLVLRFRTNPDDCGEGQAVENLLRDLSRLDTPELVFGAEDVAEPRQARLDLRTITVVLHYPDFFKRRLFSLLTSASTTTLVSITLPACPRSASSDAAMYDLSPFLRLTFLELPLPIVDRRFRINRTPPPLVTFCRQLDELPAGVRHLILPSYAEGMNTYPAAELADAGILSHIPVSVHRLSLPGVHLEAAYVAAFLKRAPALEWKVLEWRPEGEDEGVVAEVVGAFEERGIEVWQGKESWE